MIGRKIKFAGGDKESLIKRGVKALVRKLNRTSKEVILRRVTINEIKRKYLLIF